MARRATLRASDADREQVAERLRRAAGEGRILAEELEERLEVVFSARTYGELDVAVADLPGTTVRRRERPMPALRQPGVIVALALLLPVIILMVIAAMVVITTLVTAWAVALALGWWVFGHHHRYAPGRRSLHARGRWPAGRPGAPRPRPWI
jgi:hypothetical protein